MAMNFEQARINMVENQVRPWDVTDSRVLETLAAVRRENFVPERYRTLAFADLMLPLGHGEVMLKPVVEGRLLQALALEGDEKVLEIGTGSGFLTACLARLAASVTSIDIHAEFSKLARTRLAEAGMRNVQIETADAFAGYRPAAAFDVVVVGGAVHATSDALRELVAANGRLFAFVGTSPAIEARLYTQAAPTRWQEQSLFDTDVPYLRNAAPPRRFAL